MDPMFFIKGLIIGFTMAVPIGPVGIICIRKTLAEGHVRGMIIGLGAATADAFFGCIAAFGLTFVSDVVSSQHFWIRLGGGALLLFLGIRTFRAKRKDVVISFEGRGFLGAYISSFLLALTNPVTIFAFIALFAAFGLGNKIVFCSASLLVIGVFAGSCLWFLSLSYIATRFRKKLDSGGLRWVNRISGILIVISGCVAFISLI